MLICYLLYLFFEYLLAEMKNQIDGANDIYSKPQPQNIKLSKTALIQHNKLQ